MRGLSGNLAVVSSAGTYHNGKSFLLDALIGDSSSSEKLGDFFPIGGTSEATTMGLWAWGLPVDGSALPPLSDGEAMPDILFVDSEGDPSSY